VFLAVFCPLFAGSCGASLQLLASFGCCCCCCLLAQPAAAVYIFLCARPLFALPPRRRLLAAPAVTAGSASTPADCMESDLVQLLSVPIHTRQTDRQTPHLQPSQHAPGRRLRSRAEKGYESRQSHLPGKGLDQRFLDRALILVSVKPLRERCTYKLVPHRGMKCRMMQVCARSPNSPTCSSANAQCSVSRKSNGMKCVYMRKQQHLVRLFISWMLRLSSSGAWKCSAAVPAPAADATGTLFGSAACAGVSAGEGVGSPVFSP